MTSREGQASRLEMTGGVEISAQEEGMRCDRWLSLRYPLAPKSMVHKWIRSGQVRISGGRCKANQRLQSGQTIRTPPQSRYYRGGTRSALKPEIHERLCAMVLEANDSLLFINKPAGLAVQGGTNVKHNLADWLSAIRPEKETTDSPFHGEGSEPPVLVHRLDKETSGLMMIARNRFYGRDLASLFKNGQIKKAYLALLDGIPKKSFGIVDSPIHQVMPDLSTRTREALTSYRILDDDGKVSLALLCPKTGRKHQLRIHCRKLGHSILGDRQHGSSYHIEGVADLCLHACALYIPPPIMTTGMTDCFSLPIPFQKTMTTYGLTLPESGDLRKLCRELWRQQDRG